MNDPILLMAALGTGFVLGLRHALDPDHLVAVSALTTRAQGKTRSMRTGALWGIGHTGTLLLACLFVVPLNLALPHGLAAAFEGAVGIMLLFLGFRVIAPTTEQAQQQSQIDYQPVLVGAVHGLAGSAALAVMVMTTIDSVVIGILYVVVFGFGSIAGMLVLSGILSIPIMHFGRRAAVWAGVASMVMGLLILVRLIGDSITKLT